MQSMNGRPPRCRSSAKPLTPLVSEYYPRGDTAFHSTTLSATIIHETNSCFDLDNPAKSFHIGGPSTQVQVPKGCTIAGYAEKGCKGALNLQIQDKSSTSRCYNAGTFMGNTPPVKRVVLKCE